MSEEDHTIALAGGVKFNFKYSKNLLKCSPPKPPNRNCPSRLIAKIPNHTKNTLKYLILQTFREEVDGCSSELIIDGPDRIYECCQNSNDPSKLPYHSCDYDYIDNPEYD